MAKQDPIQRAKERYSDALDEMRDTHARIVEDLKFSNPAKPEQWPTEILTARGKRPTYTFDRVNQFIQQVVNDARMNKPSIDVLPADSIADPDVADQLSGIIRHVEYVSRAGIAYDTAIELSARCGLGWLRVVPEVMRPETNEQEARILRVSDPLGCMLEAGWTQPDGSDAKVGWASTWMTRRAFKQQYPKADASAGWADPTGNWSKQKGDSILVVEEFDIEEAKADKIRCLDFDGNVMLLTEEEYWKWAADNGTQAMLADPNTPRVEVTQRMQKWRKMTGAEVLDETDFPSQFLPIIPVLGFEVWIEGERFVCGITRRLMDGQRLHNYEMTAFAEALANQPKAPFMVPARGMDGLQEHWKALASGNPAYLPYNDVDAEGQPVAAPTRLPPPAMPASLAQGAVMASQEMEAAIGMFKANLGQPSNETSGRAINARKVEGDTATFHFVDNLARSIEQLGRVVVDMIPRLYDETRRARILGLGGEQSFIDVDPKMPQAAKKQGAKVIAINPNVGCYDVRVKVGPAFTTQRQETAAQLSEMMRGNPQMLAVLGPMWARLQDFPEADKLAKTLLAIAPPGVQQLEEEDAEQIPPQIQAQLQGLQQQIKQMGEALNNASQMVDKLEAEKASKDDANRIAAFKAENERLQMMLPYLPPGAMAAIAQSVGLQVVATDDISPASRPGQMPVGMPPMPAMPPDGMQEEMNEPPSGGFSLPEQGAPDLAQADAMQLPTQ